MASLKDLIVMGPARFLDKIYGNLEGNATSANKLSTARSISLAGKVTGSTTFDGSGNVSITTSFAKNYAGSSTDGGIANSALKLVNSSGTAYSIGSANKPVYFSNGIPVEANTIENAKSAEYLSPGAKINGTTFTGSGDITTTTWGTARTITISDNSGTNTQANTNINGGENFTLKLPATIKANLTGKATSAGTADSATTATTAGTTTGNAGSATKLQTARTINGTGFDGTGNITTSYWGTTRTLTIGNKGQSVNGSGNVSWSLNDIGASDRNLLKNNYKSITVAGNADTYYPVLIDSGHGSLFGWELVSISRGYAATAPDTWNTATHKGGLTLTLRWTGDSAWGGNDKTIVVEEFNESYTTMVGGLELSVNGLIVWLRGGGAVYYLTTPYGQAATATVNLTDYTASDKKIYSARTYNADTVNTEVRGKWYMRQNKFYGSASTLMTSRTINGTSFDGSGNITTSYWGTARTLTVGNTGKSVNGGGDVSWSIAEIGAVNKIGDTMTGDLSFKTTNYTSTPVAVRDDGTTYGHTLLVGAGGTTYVGAGEAASALYSKLAVKTTEELFLCADSNIKFYTGAESATTTSGITLNTSNQFYPQTNNAGSLGTSSYKWGSIYSNKGYFGGTSTTDYALNTTSFICDSWIRSKGDTGWYNETYGGGWYMTDTTWIRAYSDKPIYVSNTTNSAIYTSGAVRGTKGFTVDETMAIYPEKDNEINFGGTGTNTAIYMGYRATGSRAIPTKFIFGSSGGTASLQCNTVYLGSGTSSYVSSSQYTGNAATATKATQDASGNTITTSYLRRYNWWDTGNGNNIDTLRAGITFAYTNHNAPDTGTIVSFDCSTSETYTLQIMGGYSSNILRFRNRNGDSNTWNAWKTILDSSNYTSYTVTKTGSGASGSWGINITGSSASCTGNAASATKLATSRNIALSGDFTGSASFNGTANATISATNYKCAVSGGNTNSFPYHRIAYITGKNGQWSDSDCILDIKHNYNGGGFGRVKVSFRTNGTGTAVNASATWLYKYNIKDDAISIAYWGVTGDSCYADVFYKHGVTYPRCTIYQVYGSRVWTLVDSNQPNDGATATEAYASISAAATALHSGTAYTDIVESTQANSVGILPISGGGTGASTASAALSNLGGVGYTVVTNLNSLL